VPYVGVAMDELALAYASTIHKSQGSEYPAVVIPFLTSHFVMLTKNLLYTAVTRGKQLVVLVADPRAVRIALSPHELPADADNQRPDAPPDRHRATKLATRLRALLRRHDGGVD
jgi:UvrD-like helicase C-terminal domain